MKNYEIKYLLKKEVLIIEWQDDYEIVGRIIFGKSNQKGVLENIFNLDGYTLLGSPDEIKEEDVRDLVEKITTTQYKNYGYVPHYFGYLLSTAIESFNSALESEILWENPHGKEEPNKSYFLDDKGSFLRQEKKQWHKAQEKTFDKKRTLIFVKI